MFKLNVEIFLASRGHQQASNNPFGLWTNLGNTELSPDCLTCKHGHTHTHKMNHCKNVGGLCCGQSQLHTSVSSAFLCHKYLVNT